jgi:lipoic acid synthetase
VVRYVPPEEFAILKEEANKLGFPHVESGPMVRSSYHADGQRDIVRSLATNAVPENTLSATFVQEPPKGEPP